MSDGNKGERSPWRPDGQSVVTGLSILLFAAAFSTLWYGYVSFYSRINELEATAKSLRAENAALAQAAIRTARTTSHSHRALADLMSNIAQNDPALYAKLNSDFRTIFPANAHDAEKSRDETITAVGRIAERESRPPH